MKNGLMTLAFSCSLALLPVAALAQPQQPQPTNAPSEKLDPKQQIERMSYAIGMDIGRNLQRGGVQLDIDRMAAAMKDA